MIFIKKYKKEIVLFTTLILSIIFFVFFIFMIINKDYVHAFSLASSSFLMMSGAVGIIFEE